MRKRKKVAFNRARPGPCATCAKRIRFFMLRVYIHGGLYRNAVELDYPEERQGFWKFLLGEDYPWKL